MKRAFNAALDELRKFLSTYSLCSISENEDLQSDLKFVFKRYYALLIWNTRFHGSDIWKENGEKDSQFKLYFLETTSDICLALFLFFQGLHKPSLLILRSGIENFFRCIGIAYDQDIALTSVYELIDTVKNSEIKADKIAYGCVTELHNKYAMLCQHVHTAELAHMSLTTVVGGFPRYKSLESKSLSKQIANICTSICTLNCIITPNIFHSMHHSHKDRIYDILPKKVKKHLLR